MNESQLNTALTVARTGSLAKASAALFLSIQGVKDRIDALERELGCTLFERSSKGMSLTPSGEKFVEKAPSLLRHIGSFMEEVANPDAARPMLRVQAPPVRVRIMDDICHEFSRRRPDVVLRFVQTSADRLFEDLRDCIADAGFTSALTPLAYDLESEEIPGLSTRFKCLLSRDDADACELGDTVPLSLLEGRKLAYAGLYPEAVPIFDALNVSVTLSTDPYEAVDFCMSGGTCICTEYFDTDFPQVRSAFIEGCTVANVCFHRPHPSTEVLDFVDAARDVAAGMSV